jgi:hypothetical protein
MVLFVEGAGKPPVDEGEMDHTALVGKLIL